MKARTCLLILLVGTFAPGCVSPSLWQDPRPISPSSYSVAAGSMPRSVGRLRKLVLAPARVHVVLPFFEGHSSAERTAASAAELREYWEDESQRFLRDWRGYEVIVLAHETYWSRLGLSDEDIQKRLDTLAEWVEVMRDGDETPDRVMQAVCELTRPLGADGLLLINGEWKASNASIWLTPLTLGWSTFFSALEGGQRFHVFIFEAASGRLVWHRFKAGFRGLERFHRTLFLLPSEVFEALEPAVPSALIAD